MFLLHTPWKAENSLRSCSKPQKFMEVTRRKHCCFLPLWSLYGGCCRAVFASSDLSVGCLKKETSPTPVIFERFTCLHNSIIWLCQKSGTKKSNSSSGFHMGFLKKVRNPPNYIIYIYMVPPPWNLPFWHIHQMVGSKGGYLTYTLRALYIYTRIYTYSNRVISMLLRLIELNFNDSILGRMHSECILCILGRIHSECILC